jgi:glucuronate isomerase
MKKFLDENFLLQTETAQKLYHEYAKQMPIIDYHCHLPPDQIAADLKFENLTQVWLYGDHYKWRAMRSNGVNEDFITGKNTTDYQKFEKWAETVPYTMRNPLYHWTHLELQRYFDIDTILSGKNAREVYDACTAKLQTEGYTTRGLMRKMNVKVVCTTDDPIDSLEYHQQIKASGFEVQVRPTFRPDKAMASDDVPSLKAYIAKVGEAADVSISNFNDYLAALKKRHEFFAELGCGLSDHGLEQIYAEDYTDTEIEAIFLKILAGQDISYTDNLKFKSAMLYHFAIWDHAAGWVQQFHLGALRNNNARRLRELGPDTGWDSIGDFSQARAISKFLNRLDGTNQLAKTILYNLNPADNELMATMIGNFNDGSVAGKVQFGSAWWFLDQKDGMIKQMNALSNMGLLSRLVGMLTDSRSFLSYPRHEYFRRLLCNLFGDDVENGELPNDVEWLGKIVQDICYYNAKNYFNW